MKRIHYTSGLLLVAFIALHLLNHSFSLLGAGAHIRFMEIARVVYRNPIVELALLGCVMLQISSGILLVKKFRQNLKTDWDKIQLWSGLYLLFFLLIHVSAVIVGRMYLSLDTNFYFGVAGLNSFPHNLFFVPYYGMAIVAIFAHLAAVHNKKMKFTFIGIRPELQSKLLILIGIVFTIVLFLGLTDYFTGVVIPQEYKVLLGN